MSKPQLSNGVTHEDYSAMTLPEMEVRNAERMHALANQGVGVSMGLGYLETMLEVLLGDELPRAKEMFQRKVGMELDGVERQALLARLGVAPGGRN